MVTGAGQFFQISRLSGDKHGITRKRGPKSRGQVVLVSENPDTLRLMQEFLEELHQPGAILRKDENGRYYVEYSSGIA